jgi:hypothetical protein
VSEKAAAARTAPESTSLKPVERQTLFDWMSRIYKAIARRALEIFEGDGGALPGKASLSDLRASRLWFLLLAVLRDSSVCVSGHGAIRSLDTGGRAAVSSCIIRFM